ncbi:DNA/RNA non-specific endonuclease [Streptomyces sp. ODS28]|uniref:DNA/RNA non-specific endonuclease n=1 Tax=Streptomyces sp. ODS28 TaxID=3136688 RepID=UPI0031EEDF42
MTAVAAALAMALGGTSSAAAAPADPGNRTGPESASDRAADTDTARKGADRTAKATMREVPVEKLVTRTPDTKGNLKVLLENGKTAQIPASAKDRVTKALAADDGVSTKGRVYGNCGSSYVTLHQKSNDYPVRMRTGFDLKQPAVAYTWVAALTGPGGFADDYESSGGLAFQRSWDGEYNSDGDESEGWYYAAVAPAASNAVLWNGNVCTSGGPTELEYLTEPKAACLENVPSGTEPAGSGWIRNTSVGVDHRNKTTTPQDGPGQRASAATACLTRTGGGNAARGDITGWRDAQIFRDANAPGATLARCHLIANVLGGKGQSARHQQTNLVPCFQVGMNTGPGSMRTYETIVQNAVANDLGRNDAVSYSVIPLYRDRTSTIPSSVIMTATLQRHDGSSRSLFWFRIVGNTGPGNVNLGN